MSRNTYQKQIVLETVQQMGCHPTADAVYDQIKTAVPSISRATVFRILSQFSQEGKVQRIKNPNAADNFDHRLDAHYHIQCTKCGRVDDVELPVRQELCGQAQGETPYMVTGHDIVFYGLCPQCRRQL